jgi:hypothetical protein
MVSAYSDDPIPSFFDTGMLFLVVDPHKFTTWLYAVIAMTMKWAPMNWDDVPVPDNPGSCHGWQ